VSVLWITDNRFSDHDTGRSYPQQPARRRAVVDGMPRAVPAGTAWRPALATGGGPGAEVAAEAAALLS